MLRWPRQGTYGQEEEEEDRRMGGGMSVVVVVVRSVGRCNMGGGEGGPPSPPLPPGRVASVRSPVDTKRPDGRRDGRRAPPPPQPHSTTERRGSGNPSKHAGGRPGKSVSRPTHDDDDAQRREKEGGGSREREWRRAGILDCSETPDRLGKERFTLRYIPSHVGQVFLEEQSRNHEY